MIATTQQNMTTELVCHCFIDLFFPALDSDVRACVCLCSPLCSVRRFHSWAVGNSTQPSISATSNLPFQTSVSILDRPDSCTAVQTSVIQRLRVCFSLSALQCRLKQHITQ